MKHRQEHKSKSFGTEILKIVMKGNKLRYKQPRNGLEHSKHNVYPAWYYEIELHKEGDAEPKRISRRYSDFVQLDYELSSTPSEPNMRNLPPKTYYCQIQTHNFRENRQQELYDFLTDRLQHDIFTESSAMQNFFKNKDFDINGDTECDTCYDTDSETDMSNNNKDNINFEKRVPSLSGGSSSDFDTDFNAENILLSTIS